MLKSWKGQPIQSVQLVLLNMAERFPVNNGATGGHSCAGTLLPGENSKSNPRTAKSNLWPVAPVKASGWSACGMWYSRLSMPLMTSDCKMCYTRPRLKQETWNQFPIQLLPIHSIFYMDHADCGIRVQRVNVKHNEKQLWIRSFNHSNIEKTLRGGVAS